MEDWGKHFVLIVILIPLNVGRIRSSDLSDKQAHKIPDVQILINICDKRRVIQFTHVRAH